MYKIDYIGEKFGCYELIKKDGKKYVGKCIFCGQEITTEIYNFKNLKTSKCFHYIHGNKLIITNWKNKRIGRIFISMKQRCCNSRNKDFKHYGEKGISIFKEWLDSPKSFEDWALLNGYTDNMTIDRIDFDGNYEPLNCRWISQELNTSVKKSTNTIRCEVSLSCSKWSELLCLGVNEMSKKYEKLDDEELCKFIQNRIESIYI